jgi:hypothetical protein
MLRRVAAVLLYLAGKPESRVVAEPFLSAAESI